jgi:hypothetical protein
MKKEPTKLLLTPRKAQRTLFSTTKLLRCGNKRRRGGIRRKKFVEEIGRGGGGRRRGRRKKRKNNKNKIFVEKNPLEVLVMPKVPQWEFFLQK